jgi:hypothetical protein
VCKFWFAATEIVDLIHQTYLYGMLQIGMKDRSLNDEINQTFIALTARSIHYCLLAWNPVEFSIPPQFIPELECNTSMTQGTLIK